MIYIMSDLAVPSCEKRFSKLILLCLTSSDVKHILDQKYVEDFHYACTTAFSRHPSSMKYRGIFKLHKRIEDPDKYRLNYYAPFGRHSLAEALTIWRKRYG